MRQRGFVYSVDRRPFARNVLRRDDDVGCGEKARQEDDKWAGWPGSRAC